MKNKILTMLAPYLPFSIRVNYEVFGLQRWHEHEANLTPFRLFEITGANAGSSFRKIKPVLRTFSQLTSTILHEGKEVVPAVEVARLALGEEFLGEVEYNLMPYLGSLEIRTDNGCIEIDEEYNITRQYNHQYGSKDGTHYNQVAIVDLLRSMHFNIGFAEGEYIEKQA